ncbi:hypothetical protein [Streptomyces sp. G-G2]|uniref:hypothetical protein n=1 Tax=Streptomyces sp. G-G2 TaxID=3046201 RepID=UPI0024B8E393|nr:hypothetical protein [Streptomyces sp. G-G2]MDJ0380607.1 hypothetical protein [Streptomyces sp. G-G2]
MTASAIAVSATALFTLTGCFPFGGSDEGGPFPGRSGSQVANTSIETLRGASSLTITGTVRDQGKPIKMDMAISRSGDCRGTMTVDGEGSFELIRNSQYVFLKADAAFYRTQMKDLPKEQADAALAQLPGHWVKSKANAQDSKDLAQLCDLGELLKQFEKSAGARKEGVVPLGGQQAAKLSTKTTDGTEDLYVATTGKPYLLKAVETGKEPSEVSFSGFDQPVRAESPTGDVIDSDG